MFDNRSIPNTSDEKERGEVVKAMGAVGIGDEEQVQVGRLLRGILLLGKGWGRKDEK